MADPQNLNQGAPGATGEGAMGTDHPMPGAGAAAAHAGGAPESAAHGGQPGTGSPGAAGDQSLFDNGGQGEARAAQGGTIAPEGAGSGSAQGPVGTMNRSGDPAHETSSHTSGGHSSQGSGHPAGSGSSVPISSGSGSPGSGPSHRFSSPPSTPDTWGPDFGWLDTPYRAMRGFFDQVGRLADDFSSGRPWLSPDFTRSIGRGIGSIVGSPAGIWSPAVEVYERDGAMVISADLPGMTRSDITVEVTDNSVIIEGERRSSGQSTTGGSFRSERYYGRFSRRIPLPEGADTAQTKATFNDGVLELVVPMAGRDENRRRIEIS